MSLQKPIWNTLVLSCATSSCLWMTKKKITNQIEVPQTSCILQAHLAESITHLWFLKLLYVWETLSLDTIKSTKNNLRRNAGFTNLSWSTSRLAGYFLCFLSLQKSLFIENISIRVMKRNQSLSMMLVFSVYQVFKLSLSFETRNRTFGPCQELAFPKQASLESPPDCNVRRMKYNLSCQCFNQYILKFKVTILI